MSEEEEKPIFHPFGRLTRLMFRFKDAMTRRAKATANVIKEEKKKRKKRERG